MPRLTGERDAKIPVKCWSLVSAKCGDEVVPDLVGLGDCTMLDRLLSVIFFHDLNLSFDIYDVAEADAVAAPVASAPRPLSAEPVRRLLVSLLLSPVGCKRSRGIAGKFFRNLPATTGPTIRATKIMNITK